MKHNIINLTHRDFDGITCSIILHEFCKIKKYNFSYFTSTYRNVDDRFLDILNSSPNSDIYLTDISLVDEDKFKDLDNKDNIIFIDHHPREQKSKIKNQYHSIDSGSAAKMVYNYLQIKYNIKFNSSIRRLVLIASDYDTWTHKYNVSKKMNRLFFYYGVDKFYKRFLNGWNGTFNQEEKEFFIAKDNEIEEVRKNLMVEFLSDNKVAFISVTREIDEMAEYIQKKYKVPYVLVYNHFIKSLSLRATKEAQYHMGEFAKTWNGGGHEKAGAIRINKDEDLLPILNSFVERVTN